MNLIFVEVLFVSTSHGEDVELLRIISRFEPGALHLGIIVRVLMLMDKDFYLS